MLEYLEANNIILYQLCLSGKYFRIVGGKRWFCRWFKGIPKWIWGVNAKLRISRGQDVWMHKDVWVKVHIVCIIHWRSNLVSFNWLITCLRSHNLYLFNRLLHLHIFFNGHKSFTFFLRWFFLRGWVLHILRHLFL
jgi:hypothetical protein